MDILSAKQLDERVEIYTTERGAVIVNTPEDAALLAQWIADGGVVAMDQLPAQPAQLSREAFCVALISAGIFTEAEASEAALGAWPAKFEPALAGKDLIEVLMIKNLWREAKTVSRDAPLFVDLLAYYAHIKSLSAAQTAALGDAIFAKAGV
jgi:hypothetical protein